MRGQIAPRACFKLFTSNELKFGGQHDIFIVDSICACLERDLKLTKPLRKFKPSFFRVWTTVISLEQNSFALCYAKNRFDKNERVISIDVISQKSILVGDHLQSSITNSLRNISQKLHNVLIEGMSAHISDLRWYFDTITNGDKPAVTNPADLAWNAE